MLRAARAARRSLRVKAGRRVTWQALVTWRDGGPCEAAPGSLHAGRAGHGRARAAHPRRRGAPAFVGKGHLRVLATGDSMIQIIDSFLKQRLERRRATSVRSDARISTGLSKPFMLDWVKKAREQARSVHPDVTAMFIGANDGFPMKTRTGASVPCCGAAWTAEYARRVESMMRSYLRGGRSYVYWMTLPTPRRGDFARIYRAVNRAIKRAAARASGAARASSTSSRSSRRAGAFASTCASAARPSTRARATASTCRPRGASIAATLLIDRLRADHALPRLR